MYSSSRQPWPNVSERRGGICVHSEICGDALAIKHNGGLYSCVHFVYPQYKLGNLSDRKLVEMVENAPQRAFGNAKRDSLPQYCRDCEVRFLCNGGCPYTPRTAKRAYITSASDIESSSTISMFRCARWRASTRNAVQSRQSWISPPARNCPATSR